MVNSLAEKKRNPLASVLIPCYNKEDYVAQAIESALSQTYENIEIIVVNDGSTDSSLDVVNQYRDKIIIESTGNNGACHARNVALELSSGDYIQYLDADDVIATEKIDKQVNRLLNEDNCAIACSEWYSFKSTMEDADLSWRSDWHDYENPLDWLLYSMQYFSMMPQNAWLCPRNVITNAGDWNETLTINQDGEFFSRVILKSSKIAFCKGARVYYRRNTGGSVTESRYSKLQSLYQSVKLITEHVLLSEDSLRTRKASIALLQSVAFHCYPEQKELLSVIESHIKGLGDVGIEPWRLVRRGGLMYSLLEELIGWKRAKVFRAYIRSCLT